MKNIVLGFVLAVAVALTIVGGMVGYKAVRYANAAAGYLFTPTDVKDKDGKALTRAQMIDAALKSALTKQQ